MKSQRESERLWGNRERHCPIVLVQTALLCVLREGSRSLFLISVNDCGDGVVRGRPEECVYVRARRRGGGERGRGQRETLPDASSFIAFLLAQVKTLFSPAPPPTPRALAHYMVSAESWKTKVKQVQKILTNFFCCKYIEVGRMGKNVVPQIYSNTVFISLARTGSRPPHTSS